MGLERSNNEDNFILNADLTKDDWFIPSNVESPIELGEVGCLFVVADGMGGMNAGEVASAIAVDTVKELYSVGNLKEVVETDDRIQEFMCWVVEEADKRIKAKQKEDESTSGMGTTIVMAWVVKDRVHVCWCGDSRAYLFNKASGLVRLSKDHSYVQELVDDGKLDPELAFDHPNSNIITRSLGDSRSSVNPDYMSRRIVPGDQILLCSDGLCGMCRDEEIVEVFDSNCTTIAELRSKLLERALNAGGYDNVTVALFETVGGADEAQEDMSETFIDLEGEIRKEKGDKLKKNLKKYVPVLLVLVVSSLFFWNEFYNEEASLGEDNLTDNVGVLDSKGVKRISLDTNMVQLVVDSSYTLNVNFVPDSASNKNVTWSSSNRSVAEVDNNGKVKAVSAGVADITVISVDGGKTAKCKVEVEEAKKASAPAANDTAKVQSISLIMGPTMHVPITKDQFNEVVFEPGNSANRNFSVTSDNDSIVGIRKEGSGFYVHGKKIGTANLEVKSEDGGKTANVQVSVFKDTLNNK